MKKLKQIIAILALTAGLLSPVSPANSAQTSSGQTVDGWPYAPGVVLVGLQPGATIDSLSDIPAIQAVNHPRSELERLGIARLQVTPGQESAVLAALRRQPQVRFAEPDYQASASGFIPDDPYYGYQWYLEKIGAPGAWEIQTGSPQVTIALLDSGVQLDHPDLQGQLWTNPGEIAANGLDDDNNGLIDDLHGWHYYHNWTTSGYVPADDGNIMDNYGHGTHIAGIAAAAGNNSLGVAGLVWGTRLMPVKVLDQYGNGWYSDIAAGILYAADNGARAINLSLGGINDSQTLKDAIDYARARDILVAAAAGNDGGPVLFPASYAPVLAVAATDANDLHPSYSNHGPEIDLAAPGSQIYSTWYRTNYFSKSGTSMAVPQVTATAALLWSQLPGLSLSQIENLLIENCDDLGSTGKDELFGYGRLNAHRSLVRLTDQPDLWLELLAPAVADYGETLHLTLLYGNQGNGIAPGVTITISLPAELQPLGPTTWGLGDLAANSSPNSQTLDALAIQSGAQLTIKARIATSGYETLLDDNQANADTLLRYKIDLPILVVNDSATE